jgi:hypothetical protein
MADALDEARDKTNAGKRATLEAMANHGSAGVADLARQQQVIRDANSQALNTLTSEAVGRGAPAAALGQLTDIAGQPGANAARIMGQAGDAYAADAARLQTAHGNYMDEASAAVPVIRADADRRIGILREQWEQRKRLQEEQEREEQEGLLDLPQYLQEAYLNATLAAGPEGMAGIDAQLATINQQIAAERERTGTGGAPPPPSLDEEFDPKDPRGLNIEWPEKDHAALDMLLAERDRLLTEKDTLVPSGAGAWDTGNVEDVAAAYSALGVDPVAAAGLAMQYVQDNTPDPVDPSEELGDQRALLDMEAMEKGYPSYEAYLEATGQNPGEPVDPMDPPNRELTLDEAARVYNERVGEDEALDDAALEEIVAADYYNDAYDTATAQINDWIDEEGAAALKEHTWDELEGILDDSFGGNDDYKGRLDGKKASEKYGRTYALVREQLGHYFGRR